MAWRDWVRLLSLAAIWSTTFYLAAVALRGFGPLTIAAGRVAIGAAALGLWLAVHRTPLPVDWRSLTAFLIMGGLNNALPFSLIFMAQTQIAGGVAAILNATTPLFTAILASWLGMERLTAARIAGLLIGIAGVALVVAGDAAGGIGRTAVADGAVLLAALFYALAGVFGRRRLAGLRPQVAACGMLAGSAAMLVPLALLIEQPWRAAPAPEALIAVGLLGLCGAALAYVLYFRILAGAGATNLLLVTFLLPVGALLLGAMLLGERVRLSQLAGVAPIFAALVLVDGRMARWLRATWRPAGAT